VSTVDIIIVFFMGILVLDHREKVKVIRIGLKCVVMMEISSRNSMSREVGVRASGVPSSLSFTAALR